MHENLPWFDVTLAKVLDWLNENTPNHFDNWDPDFPPDYYTKAYWENLLRNRISDFLKDKSMCLFLDLKALMMPWH